MICRTQWIFTLFLFLQLAFTTSSSLAQPVGKTHRSVESLVSSSEFVAIGSIKRVSEHIIVQPGTIGQFGIRDERGKIEYVIETQFDEILKKVGQAGEGGEFESFKTMDLNAGKNEQLAKWAENKTSGLWLIHPKFETESFHRWEFVPFDDRGINHFGYRSYAIKPPMFANDLSILTTREQILERLREYGPISQDEYDVNKPRIAGVRIPNAVLGEIDSGDYDQLILAFDSSLPKLAQRLVESPRDFVSQADVDREPFTLDALCLAGIELLGQMKTESSIDMLRKCLNDSILPFKHCKHANRIRIKAYERLLDWQVNPTRPKFSDDIKVLFLGYSGIDDKTLALVSEHVNLESITLWETDISHIGIEHLAGLKKLKLISLGDQLVTDKILQTLRKNDQLHLISQAIIAGSLDRPSSLDEVTSLKFWCAPFTDAGLKELSFCKNLKSIDLGRMNITDLGTKHLARCQNLRMIRLRETHVTEIAIASLRNALPDCNIEFK